MRNIENTASEMAKSYENTEFAMFSEVALPEKEQIISVLDDIQALFFPAYFGKGAKTNAHDYAQQLLSTIYFKIKKQIELALSFKSKENVEARAKEIADDFTAKLPYVHSLLIKDVQATFEGDPAASSKEEIIFSYPGFYAIFVYRVAHLLYLSSVPFVPRIMTELAHNKTGIDINPGATIGEYFFIDHGTGIVIGETTIIGDHVKLYQGVTLGALSPRKGQSLCGVKRHPTVLDGVTIYSGASILGGDTIIGKDAVIGGNSFITQSVPQGARVSIKQPELIIKSGN